MTQGARLLTAGMIRNGFCITGTLWGEPMATNYSELTSLQLLNLQINQQTLVWILDNGLSLNSRQAIIWANGGIVHWHMDASLGLSELTHGSTFVNM